jgi:heme A synthase
MESVNNRESASAGSKRFARFAWFVTALTLSVILWGAYVRASGSGDGCGAHWPLCNGTAALPQATATKTLVEFAHRATSGFAFLLVVVLFVWAFRKFERGHPVRKAAALSALFIVTESLIGAGLVLLRLVADNASVARAIYLSVHLVNTFILVAALALTAWWASVEGAARPRLREFLRGRVGAALACALAVGVSGAVAALGSTLFTESAQADITSNLSAPARLMFSLRQYKLHPLLALLVGGYVVHFAVSLARTRTDAWVRRWASAVVASVFAQVCVGLFNAAMLAPVWMQIIHLLFADLLWLALVLLSASSLARVELRADEAEQVSLRQAVEI